MPRKANRSGPSRNGAAAPGEPGASTEDLFRQYTRTRELAMRDLLIGRHTHLVQAVARRFTGMGESAEDLVQEGTMGLINAVDLFDVDRGVKFTTYATHLIGGQIQHYLRDKGKLIRQPAWIQELSGKITKTTEALTQKLKRTPTPAEIAQALQISEDTVRDSLRARERTKVASLDVQREDDSESQGPGVDTEKLEGAHLTPLQMQVEDRLLLEQAIAKLKDLERRVVRYFFYHDLNQTEIARKLDISVNYASYLLRGALTKLRSAFETQAQESEAAIAPVPPAPRGRVPMAPAALQAPADLPTGLASLGYLQERLRQEVLRCQRYPQNFAVMLVLAVPGDGGEPVSDPAVLAQVVVVLRSGVRSVDLLARVDRATLALLLPHTGGEAKVLGKRLIEQVRSCGLACQEREVGLAVGYAIYPTDGRCAEEMLDSARRAAEQARAGGGSRICRVPRGARLRRPIARS